MRNVIISVSSENWTKAQLRLDGERRNHELEQLNEKFEKQ